MIPLSPEAESQLDELLVYYEQRERPEAVHNLIAAVEQAGAHIEQAPDSGLPAPRPYPALAALGLRWIKQGAYWFAYADPPSGPIIAGVFYVSADIPNRLTYRE